MITLNFFQGASWRHCYLHFRLSCSKNEMISWTILYMWIQYLALAPSRMKSGSKYYIPCSMPLVVKLMQCSYLYWHVKVLGPLIVMLRHWDRHIAQLLLIFLHRTWRKLFRPLRGLVRHPITTTKIVRATYIFVSVFHKLDVWITQMLSYLVMFEASSNYCWLSRNTIWL